MRRGMKTSSDGVGTRQTRHRAYQARQRFPSSEPNERRIAKSTTVPMPAVTGRRVIDAREIVAERAPRHRMEESAMSSTITSSTHRDSPAIPSVHIRHILCPTDAAEFSRRAREYATAIARWYGGEITGLTVVPGISPSAALPEFAPSVVIVGESTDHVARDAKCPVLSVRT